MCYYRRLKNSWPLYDLALADESLGPAFVPMNGVGGYNREGEILARDEFHETCGYKIVLVANSGNVN